MPAQGGLQSLRDPERWRLGSAVGGSHETIEHRVCSMAASSRRQQVRVLKDRAEFSLVISKGGRREDSGALKLGSNLSSA